VKYFAGPHGVDCRPQLFCGAFKQLELQSWCRDDYHADSKGLKRLLILHPSVCGQEDIEMALCSSQKITISKRAPAFFLYGANVEFAELPPEQPRQILVEKHAFHAIFATSARLASSRKVMACSRRTPG